MLKLILCLVFSFSFNASAQDLPDHLEMILIRSQEVFVEYQSRTAEQIEDGVYDQTDLLLFSQIDQVNTFDLIFTKEEIKHFKIKLVRQIAATFEVTQLEAIVRVGRSELVNRRKAARYFEVALEYKTGKLVERLIPNRCDKVKSHSR